MSLKLRLPSDDDDDVRFNARLFSLYTRLHGSPLSQRFSFERLSLLPLSLSLLFSFFHHFLRCLVGATRLAVSLSPSDIYISTGELRPRNCGSLSARAYDVYTRGSAYCTSNIRARRREDGPRNGMVIPPNLMRPRKLQRPNTRPVIDGIFITRGHCYASGVSAEINAESTRARARMSHTSRAKLVVSFITIGEFAGETSQ